MNRGLIKKYDLLKEEELDRYIEDFWRKGKVKRDRRIVKTLEPYLEPYRISARHYRNAKKLIMKVFGEDFRKDTQISIDDTG